MSSDGEAISLIATNDVGIFVGIHLGSIIARIVLTDQAVLQSKGSLFRFTGFKNDGSRGVDQA